MSDASFHDGREVPLNLGALEVEDLQVVSSLVQDAVFPISEMSWRSKEHRFALLLNRFRWEDLPSAEKRDRPVERVQSLLVVESVLGVASQGLDRSDKDMILSLLSVQFEPGDDGAGHVLLTLAGDGSIRLAVETLEVSLRDVTRPYVAPSKKVPDHSA
ncbi:DUF2948 family protein [Phaeobacter sp. 11ANDIMAR09]|uniref:DUF2948 family protein n=1 Tax=Phaeobacter sp. 11ANDIMAR09 TaxID=1225647 RepID=UPI0006C8464F|nr:DUF2948 family protein [Phaeobacter sp. 11ANDIMAR09]KPD10533.1 hypothetical protein AN476_20485 [Phaeobacter sp. 11ANDIMAR09]